jgi:hypothetical protein
MRASVALAIAFSVVTALLYTTYPANELAKSYLIVGLTGSIMIAMFLFRLEILG